MSAQNHEFETPFLSAVDKNENQKKISVSVLEETDTCCNSQEELYTELNACPNVNLYDTTPYKKITSEGDKASERRITGDKKRLIVCVLMVVIMIIMVIAANCFLVTIIQISEMNSKVTSLQRGLSSILAETTMQAITFNQTHVDIWQAISMLTPDALGSLNNPAVSCTAVLTLVPSSPSGYYWIRFYNGSAVHVYCDMTRSCDGVTGGWMRVAELDMTNSSSQCPSSLTEHTESNIHTCGIDSSGTACSSVTLSTGVAYSKVCGRIKAYQNGTTSAFYHPNNNFNHFNYRPVGINDRYVDGVSLTHGSPRQHIWTFAAALDETDSNPRHNCHCTNVDQANSATPPPSFVRNDYFCDTGRQSSVQGDVLYSGNPLWDGVGCGPNNHCCSFNNPPWFHKQLFALTLNDIEMRVCNLHAFSIAIESYDIYIQ